MVGVGLLSLPSSKINNESPGLSPSARVGGRLANFSSFWEEHVQDQWVLQTIKNGYSLEFLNPVPKLTRFVRFSEIASNKHAFLLEEISKMLEKGAVQKVDQTSPGYYSTFFLVTKKDGGYRPILNLRPLNKSIVYRKFRMETLSSILESLSGHSSDSSFKA